LSFFKLAGTAIDAAWLLVPATGQESLDAYLLVARNFRRRCAFFLQENAGERNNAS